MAMKKRSKSSGRGKRSSKGLDEMVLQAMSDADFVKELQKNPAQALKKHGYPSDDELVQAIEKIDFRTLGKFTKRLSPFFC
jgi:hypothetical protein